VPRRLLLALLFTTTAQASPYHLTLEAHPAAPFPFLGRFGTVTLDVYPGGVRAETFWLNGFSRTGASNVTVENPFWRMYTDVPITDIASILRKLSTAGVENASPGALQKPAGGAVKGVAALRYRLQYGADAWIDVWTTRAVPENPQLRAIVIELINGISPATASTLRSSRHLRWAIGSAGGWPGSDARPTPILRPARPATSSGPRSTSSAPGASRSQVAATASK